MTIRIGIIGCGRILAAHLQGYRLLREAGFDQFRITALCARKRDDALGYVQRGEGPPQRRPVSQIEGDPLAVCDQYVSDFQSDVTPTVYTDYRELIESGQVDAVNDFTTHELHHQIAELAFTHKLHLLTQKPLAVSVAAARQMCQQAADAKQTLAVFENARNRIQTRQLRWLVESNKIGKLKMISLVNIGNWWAPDLVVAETPWRHNRDEAGGLSLDIGVHIFNQFAHVGGAIQEVWGQVSIQEAQRRVADRVISCDADDTLICGFRTANNVEGSMHLSWSGHGEATMSGAGRGPCFYFEGGSVIGDDLQLDDGSRHSLAKLYQDEGGEDYQKHFPQGVTDHFALNHLDWLQAIEAGREPETSGQVGLRDLAAATAILESDALGERVLVDQVLDGTIRGWQRPIDEKYGLA